MTPAIDSCKTLLRWVAIVAVVAGLMQLAPDKTLKDTPWNALRSQGSLAKPTPPPPPRLKSHDSQDIVSESVRERTGEVVDAGENGDSRRPLSGELDSTSSSATPSPSPAPTSLETFTKLSTIDSAAVKPGVAQVGRPEIATIRLRRR